MKEDSVRIAPQCNSCLAVSSCVGLRWPLPSFTPGEDVQSLDSHRLELVEKLNQAMVPGCPTVPRWWQLDANRCRKCFSPSSQDIRHCESQVTTVILCSSRWTQSSQQRKSATAPSCKKCGGQRTRRARLHNILQDGSVVVSKL